MGHISEYDVETKFIDRLESIGYEYVDLKDYSDVLANFRRQLVRFNADKLKAVKGTASLSDEEFGRVLIHLDNKSVYDSAKLLRDKYVLTLDDGKTVYLDFFTSNTDRNIYQVAHQITMDKDHKDDVSYKNRYDVTVLINGLKIYDEIAILTDGGPGFSTETITYMVYKVAFGEMRQGYGTAMAVILFYNEKQVMGIIEKNHGETAPEQ